MAPRRPISRPRHRSSAPLTPSAPAPNTKLAKRATSHARLLSSLAVSKPNTAHPALTSAKSRVSRISKSSIRRRKRKDKSQLGGSGLSDLASALEGLVDPEGAQDAEKRSSDPRSRRMADAQKSIKTQPGAQKKKERIIKMERERFKGNLAGIMDIKKDTGDVQGKSNGRWEALRASIQSGLAAQGS